MEETTQPDAALLEQADGAIRAGDLASGAQLMEQAFAGAAPHPAQWLQLAGVRRALRQPQKALAAVHSALQLAPLDFMALVMRAGLIERLSDANAAGLAWDEALAQRPEGDLPGPLAAAVAAGEQLRDHWLAQRDERLRGATADMEGAVDSDTAWRLRRFRSNILRQTRPYHSEPTHFFYPGLAEREYHPRERFGWLVGLEAATDAIRAEMMALLRADDAQKVPYLQYPPHEALRQWKALNENRDWTAMHLMQRGDRIEANASRCPATMAALAATSQPDVPGASPNAMFSLLAPHTAIPAHVGVSNTRLVCHLPLVVPEGCWFRVGAETRLWREGEAFVFDDTIEHEALNPSADLRVVLIFDVWHPDLTSAEQQAVAAITSLENAAGAFG